MLNTIICYEPRRNKRRGGIINLSCNTSDPCGYASSHLTTEQIQMIQALVNNKDTTGLLWSHFDPKVSNTEIKMNVSGCGDEILAMILPLQT